MTNYLAIHHLKPQALQDTLGDALNELFGGQQYNPYNSNSSIMLYALPTQQGLAAAIDDLAQNGPDGAADIFGRMFDGANLHGPTEFHPGYNDFVSGKLTPLLNNLNIATKTVAEILDLQAKVHAVFDFAAQAMVSGQPPLTGTSKDDWTTAYNREQTDTFVGTCCGNCHVSKRSTGIA